MHHMEARFSVCIGICTHEWYGGQVNNECLSLWLSPSLFGSGLSWLAGKPGSSCFPSQSHWHMYIELLVFCTDAAGPSSGPPPCIAPRPLSHLLSSPVCFPCQDPQRLPSQSHDFPSRAAMITCILRFFIRIEWEMHALRKQVRQAAGQK